MRITDVRAYLLSSPLPEPMHMVFYGGERTIFKRDGAFLRISTDGGVTGYGPAPASEGAVARINGPIRDALVGEDPCQLETLRAKVLAGASGAVALAFGSVEVALYDLRGKMEGCPIHALLGGKVRDRIRLYGSAGMYQPPAGYAAEAAAVANLGFAAYKMRPALGPQADLETVALIRNAVGPSPGIMVDAHAWWRMGDRSYTARQIEELARAMAEHRITWLEEPFPPEDRAAYIRLRSSGLVPIAAGEHETSLDGFLEIISTGAVDVAQGDVAHHGGYASLRRVIAACGSAGRHFAFHNWGTVLEALACAHLGVCFPAEVCPWLEFPCYRHRGQPIMYPYPLADDILEEPLRIERGDLVLPDAPGLGIAVDESVIERYPYIPGPWTVFRLTSPPEEWTMSGDHAAGWEEK
jgi:L-alanine-DL-glutamate epimerase-like enolase superfamily enzyme